MDRVTTTPALGHLPHESRQLRKWEMDSLATSYRDQRKGTMRSRHSLLIGIRLDYKYWLTWSEAPPRVRRPTTAAGRLRRTTDAVDTADPVCTHAWVECTWTIREDNLQMTMISCVCVTANLDNSLSSRGLGLDMFGKDLAFLFSYGIG